MESLDAMVNRDVQQMETTVWFASENVQLAAQAVKAVTDQKDRKDNAGVPASKETLPHLPSEESLASEAIKVFQESLGLQENLENREEFMCLMVLQERMGRQVREDLLERRVAQGEMGKMDYRENAVKEGIKD